jgi:hypothetical protein
MIDLSIFKQDLDYNCAAGAVNFFVYAQSGKILNLQSTTRRLGCHPEYGTDHESVTGFLDYYFRYESHVEYGHHIQLHKMTLPMLVNYWSGEDGHYGVLTEIHISNGSASLGLFDPSSGEIVVKEWSEFVTNWYSPRYGKHWGLYLRDYAPMKEIHSGK